MTTQKVPALVVTLAAQVKMTPIAWRIEPTCVTIVFEQGPKLRFDRPPWTVGACESEKSAPLPALLPKPKAQTRVVAPSLHRTQDGVVTKVNTPARKRHSKS